MPHPSPDNPSQLGSSFRDPSGFMFRREGKLLRQINTVYLSEYRQLMESGLYEELVKEGLLVPHQERRDLSTQDALVIEPELIPYVSYPYEWCFSQLRDAALCTMDIQQRALKFGMVLKDASAYNIQFRAGRPVFIDTLSFTGYREGEPWVAYRQFCQHFLAPLSVMACTDVRLSRLLRISIDGLPLDLASKLLPLKTWLKYSLLTHIHLHARTQARYADSAGGEENTVQPGVRPISAMAFRALMSSIESAVNSLAWQGAGTEWGDYYAGTNYDDEAMGHKEQVLQDFISVLDDRPAIVHDFGANNGHFSRIAARLGFPVVAHDIDPVAVEKNYQALASHPELDILPLVQDLTNPSPSLGWMLQERESLTSRCGDGLGLALALIHHLAISNNVPLEWVAAFFSSVCRYLVIEFVPKQDSQVRRLLATREDVFPDYDLQGFEAAFGSCFRILKKEPVANSERTLFLLERLSPGGA